LWRKEKKVETFLEMPCPMCRTVAQQTSPKEDYPPFDDGAYFYESREYEDAIEEHPTPVHSQEDEILDSELDYGIEYAYTEGVYDEYIYGDVFDEDSQPDSVS
jgi:hypothetical protein